MIQNLNRHWILKELVQTDTDCFGDSDSSPLQLLQFKGQQTESENSAIWFVGGFQGATRNDGHFTNLIFKAIEKLTFDPAVDVFLTPLANPNSQSKSPKKTKLGFDMANDFPIVADYPTHEIKNSIEAKTLVRWCRSLKPKALVTFSIGQPKIRYMNVPEEIIQKLSQFSEKPAFVYGQEPQDLLPDGTPVPRDPLQGNFGAWAAIEGISWIDICVDPLKKSFDELRESDWKSSMGPAIKWLLEGFRFNPPVEEPAFSIPPPIPALEMPPEFANL
jgi:hypothetical protein